MIVMEMPPYLDLMMYSELVGVIGKSSKIIETKLDDYFVLPRSKPVDLVKVKVKMKGPKYILSAENYLFCKVN